MNGNKVKNMKNRKIKKSLNQKRKRIQNCKFWWTSGNSAGFRQIPICEKINQENCFQSMEWLTPRPINSSSLRKVLPVPPVTKPNIEYTFCCCWFYFAVIKIKSALSLCEKYDFIAIDWSQERTQKDRSQICWK